MTSSPSKISYRQTRKGDWMVCAVAQATYGPGVHKVDSPAPGYTTGEEYGRYPTEAEAKEAAEAFAVKNGRVVVEWQYPAKNLQFTDLPRLYPERTSYETLVEAEADGWININPSKSIHYHKGHIIYVEDVTIGRSFGYDLAIAVKGHAPEFARSREIWANTHPGRTTGVFDIRFRTGDVVDAIHAACKYIDNLA